MVKVMCIFRRVKAYRQKMKETRAALEGYLDVCRERLCGCIFLTGRLVQLAFTNMTSTPCHPRLCRGLGGAMYVREVTGRRSV